MPKTIEVILRGDQRLWRAVQAPENTTPFIAAGEPFPREGRAWSVPQEEGLLVVLTEAYDYRGDHRGHYVVHGDTLVAIAQEEAEDLLDPAGAEERAELRADRSLAASYWRSHGPRPAGMMPGLYEARDGSIRVCVKVSAKTFWHRPATLREAALFRSPETVTPSPTGP